MNLDKFTLNGKFLMLALDHRGSFKKLINPQDPDSVTNEQAIALKKEIIDSLKDQFSAILIDQDYGLPAHTNKSKPFLLPLEKSSHTGLTELECTAVDLRNLGASGAKILIDFDPNSENAGYQLDIAKKVMEDCRANNFPLFLEIVTHDTNLVLESLKKFLEFKVIPNVWKLEYPGTLKGCQEITKLVGVTPWILLTGGNTFEVFKSNLEVAIKGGVKGFLAGRALWQEVCTLQGVDKDRFLKETLPERFKKLAEIVSRS